MATNKFKSFINEKILFQKLIIQLTSLALITLAGPLIIRSY